MMKFVYGFNQKQSDFDGIDYDDIYIDTGRQREHLADMIAEHLRGGKGDTITILDEKIIPEQGPFRAAIAAKEATIIVASHEPAQRGAPVKFDPDTAMRTALLKIWNTPYYETHAVRLICKKLGREVSARTLKRHLGDRDFSGNE